MDAPSKARPRALITGLCGFTGRYLAQHLRAHGYAVYGTVHHAAPVVPGVYPVDMQDAAGMRAVLAEVVPDVVVHLAAIAFVAHEDIDALYQTNLIGTRHLLDALASMQAPPRHVLLASSANVYGNAPFSPIPESAPAAPANDYAVSKLAMEYLARLWTSRLPITLVRPFNYTGVGQSAQFLLPKIVQHFRARAPFIELGNLDVARDFSDVRFVVEAYRRLLELPASGAVYNICSGQATRLHDVLSLLQEISGHAIEVRVNPAFVRANEVHTLTGDPTRLHAAIGACPAPSLRETLAWMLGAAESCAPHWEGGA